MTYKLLPNKPFLPADSVARGGEAEIVRLLDPPGRVAKIFHNPEMSSLRLKKLRHLLECRPEILEGTNQVPNFAWPENLVYKDTRLVGYTMVDLTRWRSKPLSEIINPSTRKTLFRFFPETYLLAAAFNASVLVYSVHKSGYVVGDLSSKNLMFERTGFLSMIDVDSFQIVDRDGNLLPCDVATEEFIPPELIDVDLSQERRTWFQDYYSLSILIFMLLMNGVHPYQAINRSGSDLSLLEKISAGIFPYSRKFKGFDPPLTARPFEYLPRDIQELFMRAFLSGEFPVDQRPSAAEWMEVLERHRAVATTCRVHQGLLVFDQRIGCASCVKERMRPVPAAGTAQYPVGSSEPVGFPESDSSESETSQGPQGWISRLADSVRRRFQWRQSSSAQPGATPNVAPTVTGARASSGASPVQSAPKPPSQSPAPPLVANRFTGKIHEEGCEWERLMGRASRHYLTRGDPEIRSYQPCQVCRPRLS